MARTASHEVAPEEIGRRALRELREPFLQWTADGGQRAADTRFAELEHTVGLVLVGRASAREPSATTFTPEEIHDVLHLLLAAGDAALVDGLHDFLEFLDETERWTGSAEDFEACHQTMHDHSDGDDHDVPPEILDLVEAVTPAEEDAAVLALPVVRTAVALHRRAATGLVLDASGALPVSTYLAAAREAGQEAREITDVPWAPLAWLTLVRMGLVAVNADADAEGDPLRTATSSDLDVADDSENSRACRREFVGRLIRDDPAAVVEGSSYADGVAPGLLLGAIEGHPLTGAALREALRNATGDADLDERAAREIEGHLADLGALGILSPGEPWTADRGIWPAIVWGVQTDPGV